MLEIKINSFGWDFKSRLVNVSRSEHRNNDLVAMGSVVFCVWEGVAGRDNSSPTSPRRLFCTLSRLKCDKWEAPSQPHFWSLILYGSNIAGGVRYPEVFLELGIFNHAKIFNDVSHIRFLLENSW